jgi:hypothetical protein
MRADIRDGLLSMQQLTAMSCGQLGLMYGVSSGAAYRGRRHIILYGLGGRLRDEHNRPRNTPQADAPSASTSGKPRRSGR